MDQASFAQTPSTIADQARRAASGGGAEAMDVLKATLATATPNDCSEAATELVAEAPAYDALHTALRDMGIAPPEGTATEAL